MAQALLCVTGVTNVHVIDDQHIGWYTLNEIKRAADGVRLCFNEAMRNLHLAAGIEATYDEQPSPGVRVIYRHFLMGQAGPTIEKLADADQHSN